MAHKMQDIEVIAQHLAGNLNVRVNFVEGATPCTDGKAITLPTDLNKDVLMEMLGVLVHETFHIKHTSMDDFNHPSLSRAEQDVLNVLEDIRVDSLAVAQYPKAQELYEMLFIYVFNKHRAQMKDEAMAQKVLKHLILMARGADGIYYDNKALDIINALNLRSFIDTAKNTHSTYALIAPAKQLTRLLMGELRDRRHKGTQTEGTEGNEAGKGAHVEQIEKQGKVVKEADDRKSEALTDWMKASEEARGKFKARKGAHRRMKLNETKSRNYTREAQYTSDTKEAERQQSLADKAEARKSQARKDMSEADSDYHDASETRSRLNKQLEQARKTLSNEAERLAKMQEDEDNDDSVWGVNEHLDVNGFNALNKADITEQYLDIEMPKSMDDIIREFFVCKQEQKQTNDEGARLNNNKLSNLLTTSRDLFTEIEDVEHKTRVTFLVDNSGSMQSKTEVVTNALGTLLDSLQRVIDADNLPLEVGVYTFDDTVECIKAYDEQTGGKDIAERYHARGSTELLKAVNTIAEIVQDAGDDAENVCIIMTDAGVFYNEIRELANQARTDMKCLYIGINASLGCREAEELFKHNIKRSGEIVDVLSSALLESLE